MTGGILLWIANVTLTRALNVQFHSAKTTAVQKTTAHFQALRLELMSQIRP